MGCASGGVPGHMAVCICPADGCQADICVGNAAGQISPSRQKQMHSRFVFVLTTFEKSIVMIFSMLAMFRATTKGCRALPARG